MSKLLTAKEVEEIINTMLDARNFKHIAVVWGKEFVYEAESWMTPTVNIENKRFLWWKWKKTTHTSNSFVKASSLVGLVKKAEEALGDWDVTNSRDLEAAEVIRARHADRLIRSELEKP